MSNNIYLELLEKIKDEFNLRFIDNKKIEKLNRLLLDKKATYKEANELAIEVGEILKNVFGENITENILEDGVLTEEIANILIRPNMIKNYDIVSTYSTDVQQLLNRQSDIGLKAMKPPINKDRIDGIVKKIEEKEFKDTRWLLEEPIINFTQSVVDDTIKHNTELQYKSGLRPKIKRKEFGKCCDWCRQVVGEYDYPDVPDDIYKRHRYCRCTVEYLPGNGKAQDVWSKKWKDIDEDIKIDKRVSIEDKNKQIEKIKKAKTIREANKIAKEMGYDADYSGVDVKCANDWNLGLFNAKKQFPEIAEKIKFVGTAQKRNSKMRAIAREYYTKKLEEAGVPEILIKDRANKYTNRLLPSINSRTMAQSISLESLEKLPDELKEGLKDYVGITINEKYYKDYNKVLKNGLKQVESNWHPQGCYNVKATFDHEFAHQIDAHLNIGEMKEIQDLFDSRTKEEITKELSEYSWNNSNKDRYSEMVAEGWSEYCNNENPRPMAKKIGEEILKSWKKKK